MAVVLSAGEQVSGLHRRKIGVKDVVDAGINQVPDIFNFPKELQATGLTPTSDGDRLEVPVIDLEGHQGERRSEIVAQIRRASEEWGVFQLINHGVPLDIIQAFLESIKEFNEQPIELKAEFYSADRNQKVRYHLSSNLFHGVAMWKDSLFCHFQDSGLSTREVEAVPTICRKPMTEYVKCITELQDTLLELMSESLGLKSDHLKTIGCMEARKVVSHYYPACPEPTLAVGTGMHTAPNFITMVVQNHTDAFQVLYENQWIDVNVKEGSIVVNIGDMLQLISNDIFKSVVHRALARPVGPRLTSACFFYTGDKKNDVAYGPIKELIEGDNAPVYKDTSLTKYLESFLQVGHVGSKALPRFRV